MTTKVALLSEVRSYRIQRGASIGDLAEMKYKDLWTALKEEKELAYCPQCHELLTAIEFNTKFDIVLCDNVKCPKYRTPIRNVPASFIGKRRKKLEDTYGPE